MRNVSLAEIQIPFQAFRFYGASGKMFGRNGNGQAAPSLFAPSPYFSFRNIIYSLATIRTSGIGKEAECTISGAGTMCSSVHGQLHAQWDCPVLFMLAHNACREPLSHYCAQRRCLKTHRAAAVRLVLWAVRVVAVVIFIFSGPHVFFIRWIFVLYSRLLCRLFIALPCLPCLSARFLVTLATRGFLCLGSNCLIVRCRCSVLWLMVNKQINVSWKKESCQPKRTRNRKQRSVHFSSFLCALLRTN